MGQELLVNLDDLEPTNLLVAIKNRDHYAKFSGNRPFDSWDRTSYVRIHQYSTSDSVGVEPEKLLDWRKLEARTNELWKQYDTCTTLLWDTLKSLGLNAQASGAKDVWIQDESQHDKILVISDLGNMMTWESATRLINDSIGCPEKKALFIKGEDAKKFLALYKRDRTTRRRWSVYRMAFQRAVEERLRTLVDDELLEMVGPFHNNGIFSIWNDGRCYIVTSNDRGMFTWMHAMQFRCV